MVMILCANFFCYSQSGGKFCWHIVHWEYIIVKTKWAEQLLTKVNGTVFIKLIIEPSVFTHWNLVTPYGIIDLG